MSQSGHATSARDRTSDSRPGVLVTGGNGRVGRLLVDDLRADGFRAVSLARSKGAGAHRDDIPVDLTNASAVRRVVAGAKVDTVVHLASALRGNDLIHVNERIDTALAHAVAESGIKHVVLASSGSVYGTTEVSARTEHSPLTGDTPYARSKMRTERIFSELMERDSAFCLSTLRIFNLSGSRFPDSLVQRLIRADAGDPVTVIGADTFVRDYIHQSDLMAVLRASVERPVRGNTIVNIGAGVAVSTRMLLDRLRVEPDSFVEIPGEPTSSWTDISKMVRLFGVVPRAIPDRSWDDPADR